MRRFEHGGDTYGLGDVLDFSASLNPLGMPAQAVRALQQAASDGAFSAYPDPFCRDLTGVIAAREGVPESWIVATAGAGDAFARIAASLKPHVAAVCSPCYSGYEQALRPLGTRIVRHALYARNDFTPDLHVLDALDPAVDAVFLCSPNNPTGRTVPRDVLRAVLRETERWGAAVVLDECFVDFTDDESLAGFCELHPGLVVVKAFTKIYAMAGLRLGYCVTARADLAAKLREAGVPWAVSAPAQVAGLAALQAPGFVELTRDYVSAERARLQERLRALGLFVIPSQANYVLFQCATPLLQPLLQQGILVRSCENFDGLDATWYRVAVRLADEDDRLLAALGEVLA